MDHRAAVAVILAWTAPMYPWAVEILTPHDAYCTGTATTGFFHLDGAVACHVWLWVSMVVVLLAAYLLAATETPK